MKKVAFLGVSLLIILTDVYTQGCVAVRNISGFGQYNFIDNSFSNSDWFISVTSRYFKSYRDFKGTTQMKFPQDSVQTVRSFTTDITAGRFLANGWSLTFSVPVSANSRTSKLEHGGISNPAHTTHSFGIGDIRFAAHKWILKPIPNQKINFQLGLGLKLPTGNYRYEDYFYRKEDSAIIAPVNQSIQLGDGGTGIITELNTFFVLSKKISLYGNFYYLINPREQNGTSNLLGRKPTTVSLMNQVKAGNDINSVPDQYTIRAGADFKLDKWLFSAGLRHEAIPVHDLVGGSGGSRRAGHNTSVEPGIVYSMKKSSLYIYVPVIISRETKQSEADKKESALYDPPIVIFRSGGFADYLVFVGVQFRL
jgi:hypothetical protein